MPQPLSQHNISSPASQPPQSITERSHQPPQLTQVVSATAPPTGQPPYPTTGLSSHEPSQLRQAPMATPLPTDKGFQSNLPPLKPVFGVSLEDLYARDGTAVPFLVYQCFQAVELFGLDMEGIYRLSGSATHINHMKAVFNNGSLCQI